MSAERNVLALAAAGEAVTGLGLMAWPQALRTGGTDMQKWLITVTQNAYRQGTYELEAPNEDVALSLAEDIPLHDPRIEWESGFELSLREYPRDDDLMVMSLEVL